MTEGGNQSLPEFIRDMFGEELILASDMFKPLPTEDFLANKKVILIYFGASWCKGCRDFIPFLTTFYKDFLRDHPGELELVFASNCYSESEFDSYFVTMPWPGIPYDKMVPVIKGLKDAFDILEIPTLVVMDGQTGELKSMTGKKDVIRVMKNELTAGDLVNEWLESDGISFTVETGCCSGKRYVYQ